MEKVLRVFHSFEEAEAANLEERRNMTPEQRVEVFLLLRERYVTTQGLAPVYRVLELERS